MPDPKLIEMACDRFSNEYKIAMTKEAKQLVTLLVNAVETDPHPSWVRRTPSTEFTAEANQITERLPKILNAAYQDAAVVDPFLAERKELTTFDLAHHLPRSLRLAAMLGGISRI